MARSKKNNVEKIITIQDKTLRKWLSEAQIFWRSAPRQFFVQCVSSGLGFTAGMTTFQLIGVGTRISCATPVLGPIVGAVGVGVASALAGQVSFAVEEVMKGRKLDWANPYKNVSGRDIVWDAISGIIIFKSVGGRFRNLLPSDVLKPGAMAVESLPAKGKEYVTGTQKQELKRLYKTYGCHHCGTKSGPPIGDHMPCNKFVWGGAKEPPKYKTITNPFNKKFREALGLPVGPPPQRYYPQCRKCSNIQAAVVRANKGTKLIVHFGNIQKEHLTGVVVGLRQGRKQSLRGGGGGGGGTGPKRSEFNFQDAKSLESLEALITQLQQVFLQ
eukprot:TRINITY_DN5726_c0_g2_i1.p1 TRINITY_DN5726_c0_g2~~TRINITY_DN5726_c0_g2_i1.p1  ORF type:complete len:329 (-),score=38.46 TRINITY_DN5726_c0_g2_i1:304-1290(-)